MRVLLPHYSYLPPPSRPPPPLDIAASSSNEDIGSNLEDWGRIRGETLERETQQDIGSNLEDWGRIRGETLERETQQVILPSARVYAPLLPPTSLAKQKQAGDRRPALSALHPLPTALP
ncbi:hypothetical protein CVT26_006516 [Gymnopilus dilepis]|uniref:Uncharacterized protein n=1 Tax=Gymnopilus dilepis TaxID=231916 RepID=A0A409Y3K0_9AGAR|nr:hypothetical protein CVT26_006516 [Gymnopilus dilepis]